MVPPLTKTQEDGLYDLWYTRGFTFGRDKVWRKANEEGLGVSQRQVTEWLRKQETYQMYLRPKRPRVVRSTIVRAPQRVMGIDLADVRLIGWDGIQYILTGIDLFSKKGYARALLNKKADTVAEAMDNLLSEAHGIRSVRSDKGTEFINQKFKAVLKRHNVKQILSLPGKPQSNGQVERFNGILKEMIRKSMRAKGTRDWPSYLQELVDVYNNSYQITIDMTPNEAHALEDGKREGVVARTKKRATALATPPTFRVGDTVRVVKSAVANDGEKWSKTLHRVEKILRPSTPFGSTVYRLSGAPYVAKRGQPRPDWVGNKYEEDLQLVERVENTRDSAPRWDISRLLKKQSRDGEPGWMVKWTTGETTWEPVENLKRDVPKMLKDAEKR